METQKLIDMNGLFDLNGTFWSVWGKLSYWDPVGLRTNGAETQRKHLTLETMIMVQHKDWSEQI